MLRFHSIGTSLIPPRKPSHLDSWSPDKPLVRWPDLVVLDVTALGESGFAVLGIFENAWFTAFAVVIFTGHKYLRWSRKPTNAG
jgi:hypothetical protein